MIEDNLKKAKVTQFINDKLMVAVVKQVITETFLKPRSSDVYQLASERLAINLLDEAFKEMARLENVPKKEENPPQNIGL